MSGSDTEDIDRSFFESNSENSINSIKKIDLMRMTAFNIVNYFLTYVIKNPCRTSTLTGHQWVQEILHGHHVRCYEQFRMKKHVFQQLCHALHCDHKLRPTRHMAIEEQIGLFLYILG